MFLGNAMKCHEMAPSANQPRNRMEMAKACHNCLFKFDSILVQLDMIWQRGYDARSQGSIVVDE